MAKIKNIRRRGQPITLSWVESNCDTSRGCWEWLGAKDTKGYGVVGGTKNGGKLERLHRVTYALANGGAPSGLDIDHLCRVRICCRPDHLEPVTRQENLIRAPRSIRAREGSCGVCGGSDLRKVTDRSTFTGFTFRCLTCTKRTQGAYYQANKDRINAARREAARAKRMEVPHG